jgi:hypothetical protein
MMIVLYTKRSFKDTPTQAQPTPNRGVYNSPNNMLKSLSRSTFIYAIICVVILSTHYLYYPKWKKSSTEATLSWDVSGYYMYLPAIFIYKDIKQCGFFHDVRQKYRFTPDFQQAYRDHKSGNYVMKYSIGQALHYSPFFLIAHIWASNSEHYEADGFSLPYQFMISLGSLLISFLGLFYVLKYLRYYFDDCIIGFVLVLLVLGSTYLNYSAIDGAMTHNTLFTIYAILIYSTIQFYKSPSYFISGLIGLLVGLAALTRPTELLSCLIPFIFGINIFNKAHVSDRISFLFIHRYKLFLALFVCLFIGSFQLIYWNYVTDQWFIYSYQEQGFSWRHPHLWDGFFSYKSGWLIYTPIMIFSIIGFWYLYKQNPQLLSVCLIFFILFVYIAFSWDIWWYGGSLGQRTMVQAYPILLFPLASFVKVMTTFKKVNLYILMVLMLGFIYLNLWYTHQAPLRRSIACRTND